MAERTKRNPFGATQGVFKPQALDKDGVLKYRGRQLPVYRSSFELACFWHLEKNPGILWWKSESSVIVYLNPLDGKQHRYFVDLTFAAYDKASGELTTYLVEVKPESQTKPPVKTKRQRAKTFETAAKTFLINRAKWLAAYKFCKKNKYKFLVWTEDRLFEYKPEITG